MQYIQNKVIVVVNEQAASIVLIYYKVNEMMEVKVGTEEMKTVTNGLDMLKIK